MLCSLLYGFDPASPPTDRAEYDRWKLELLERIAPPRAAFPMDFSVDNGYVDVIMETASGAGSFEQGGDPSGSGSYLKLTYYYPSVPWSYSIYKIDGHTPEQQYRTGPDCTLITAPDEIFVTSDEIIRTIWNDRHGVKIIQDLKCVSLGSDPGDNEQVKYTTKFIPTDRDSHNCGCLVYYDTKLASNDGAPISTSYGYSGMAEIWFADEVPAVWRAYEVGYPPAPSDLQALGILRGFEATYPDVFWCGRWPISYSNGWDDLYWIEDAVGDFGYDTATMVKWYPRWVHPGDTLVYTTYYGIGELSEEISIYHTPPTLWSDCASPRPNPFSIDVLISNGGEATASGVSVIIDLTGTGLELAEGYDLIIDIGDLVGFGGSEVATWHIVVPPGLYDTTVCYTIALVYEGSDPIIDTFCIYLPELAPGPYGMLIEPLEGARTTCADQQVVNQFHVDFGIDTSSIRFVIEADLYTMDDPELSIINDSFLVFQPSTDYIDGFTYTWGVASFLDTAGCPILGLGGTFTPDLSGPVASNEYPENGAIIATTNIPEFTVDIEDAVTPVDESTIELEVNGIVYDMTHPALTWDGATLHFSPADAGIEIEIGDTFDICLNAANDMPSDYCEGNTLQDAPYCWTFNVNVVELYLPDTTAYIGDNILVPIYIEEVDQYNITSFTLIIDANPDVLTPLGITTDGTIVAPWAGDLTVTIDGGTIIIEGNGPTLSGFPVFFFIEYMVNTTGSEGSFTRLEFSEATFNDGDITSVPEDGFLIVLWTNPQWVVDLVFSPDASALSHTITFGASGHADDGFNPGLDLITLPPVGNIHAYFPLADPDNPHIARLQRDIRYSEALPIIWEAVVDINPDADPWTVTWRPEYLPDGRFEIYEEDGAIVDMHYNNSYSSNGDVSVFVKFSHPELAIQNVVLPEGWNLVSFPYIPTGEISFQELLPGVVSDGYWYNGETRVYEVREYPEAGKGYWVYAAEPVDTRIAGMAVDEYTISVYPGWNLIGVPYSETGSISGTGTFYWYNPEGSGYEDPAGTLNMCYGYWYFTTEPGLLHADGFSVPAR